MRLGLYGDIHYWKYIDIFIMAQYYRFVIKVS